MRAIYEHNIFKILEGESRVREGNGKSKNVTYIYNAQAPLFETNDMTEAYEMFEKMVSEGYRRDMMFIVDFGVMEKEQRQRYDRRKNNVRPEDNRIDDLVPYVNIGEFHKVFRHHNGYNMVDVKISDGRCERSYTDFYDAMMFFSTNARADLVMTIDEDITDEFGEDYKRTRILVSDNILRDQTRYRGCKKIKVERTIFKHRRPALETKSDPLLLELHDSDDVIEGEFVEVTDSSYEQNFTIVK